MHARHIYASSLFLLTTMACAPTPKAHNEASVGLQISKHTGTIYTAKYAYLGAGRAVQTHVGIWVENGKIRALATTDELKRSAPQATWVDLGDATLMPGLIDAHGHLHGLGEWLETLRLEGSRSYEEVIERVRSYAQSKPSAAWVLGRGWDQNLWPNKKFPTVDALDRAVPNRPVWVRRVDEHAGIANAEAMRRAGIDSKTQDPKGGKIIRDGSGKPTGVFVDNAMSLIERVIPPPSIEVRKARLLLAANHLVKNGLTEMHDMGIDAPTLVALKELIDAGQWPLRIYASLSDQSELLKAWFAQGPMVAYKNRLTVRSIKIFGDGALGSRGAALLAPYADDPTNTGLMRVTQEHLADVVKQAKGHGFQVNTHAIGDRAVRMVLDVYEKAGVDPSDRFRVEHLQVIHPDDLPRLAKLGVIASMQPVHATSDMGWAEARLGPRRILGAYAWQSVLKSGGRLALGSDFPVEDVNPFWGLYAAVTRQDENGVPKGGWQSQEKLSLAQAMEGFTLGAAFAAFEEEKRGTLESGKDADFTIIEGALSEQGLRAKQVLMTVVAGRIVFRQDH